MFGIFKKKTPLEKLQAKYEKLMAEWHQLSSVNRAASDAKYAEAQKVMDVIDRMTNQK